MIRKISLLLGAIMVLQASAFSTVYADTIESVYADMYGVTVGFDMNVNQDDIDGYTLMCDEQPVETTYEIDGNIVTLVPSSLLEIDKVYTLNIAGQEKQFKIKKLFYEDFSSYEDAALTEDLNGENEYGQYSITLGEGEALFKNGELAITNTSFVISDLYEAFDGRNVTFSADIKGYGKKSITAAGKELPANAGLVQILMNADSKNTENNYDSYTMKINSTKCYIGKTDSTGTFGSQANAAYGADNEKFGFSIVNNSSNIIGEDYTYTEESNCRNMGLRISSDGISAYADNDRLLNFADETYNGGYFSINADNRTLAVIDNIMLTYCTEDVIEPEYGEVVATDMTSDFNALYVTFDRTLHGTTDFSKISVYENDALVTADISLNSEDEKILNIVPEGYSASNTYKVVIGEGFGTKTMYTYKEYSFEKYIEPKEVKVIDTVMTAQNITVTLDTESDYNATLDRIHIYENDNLINANITVNGNTIIIIPESYVIDNEYKIVIDPGFGGKNVYLFEEYSYTEVLSKKAIEVTEITGDNKSVIITFNEDISSVTDFSSVAVLKNDEPIDISCAVDKNILTVNIDNFEKDVEYELMIGKGIETSTAVLKTPILKKFEIETVAFEDFEDDTIASGIEVGGKTIDGDDGNKCRIVWNASCIISVPEVVSAENVMLSYDFQLYNANLNNDDKDYNAAVPYSLWGYNLQTKEFANGYQFYVNSTTARLQQLKNKTPTDVANNTYSAWVHGDAYCDSENNEYTFYTTGDPFPEEIAEKKGVSESKRDKPPVYNIEWVKKGKNIYIYRDGELIMKGEPEDSPYETGYLIFRTQITEMMVIDNIRVSMFKVADAEGGVSASSLKLDAEDLENLQSVSGSFIIKNYTGETQPVRAIVAAYADDNKMVSAVALPISQIDAGQIQNVNFTLNNLSQTKKVALFLLDTFDNIGQYGYYEFN